MKKNKVRGAQWYKENIKKYRYGILLFNIITISIVFLIFTGILNFIIEQRFFLNVENQIISIDRDIEENSVFSDKIHNIDLDDPRISVVYYYTDSKYFSMGQIIDPKIIGFEKYGPINENDITNIKNISDDELKVFNQIKVGNHNYMTYVNKKWFQSKVETTEDSVIVCYVKIYMNIDGEISAKKELNTVLIVCSLLLLAMGSVSGYLIMKRTMIPVQEFIDKQITFVSDASHELRTPLAIVQSKLENILTNPNQKVYDISEDLAVSLKELSRLNKLTTDLLALARSDQNRLIYNLTKENLNIIVSEIVDPFIEIAEFEDRVLTFEGEDVDVLVDKDKIRELMIILLDNAMKYTNEKDTIKVVVKNGIFDAIIEVADTGIGISNETKEKIFERFYREDKTRSRETGGNGLGLSIAKTIVTDLKGKITVDHNEPKGTKFVIVIPKFK